MFFLLPLKKGELAARRGLKKYGITNKVVVERISVERKSFFHDNKID